MNDNELMDENIKNICLFGRYYNPATNHYDADVNVICDKCFRNNLDVAIGWETYDLCLGCTQSVNKQIIKQQENATELTFELPRNEVKRMMLQRQFIKKK